MYRAVPSSAWLNHCLLFAGCESVTTTTTMFEKLRPASPSSYDPPPGPPPSAAQRQSQLHPSNPYYAAPPAPPAPPAVVPTAPPPSYEASTSGREEQHPEWTLIPDSSLGPPPPALGYDASPTANASSSDADAAVAWTRAHPLYRPQRYSDAQLDAARRGLVALLPPPPPPPPPREQQHSSKGWLKKSKAKGTNDSVELIPQPLPGHYIVRTRGYCPDTTLLSNLPLYAARFDSPLLTHEAKIVYYEVRVADAATTSALDHQTPQDQGTIALGFAAPPYPASRLPGWQRGSLAVHSDDGRKYINDMWGGADFVAPFRAGDVVGLGIVFVENDGDDGARDAAATDHRPPLGITVFFTRNGRREGAWDGNGALDACCEEGLAGLRGESDLYAAVGVCGQVECEVLLRRDAWAFRGF